MMTKGHLARWFKNSILPFIGQYKCLCRVSTNGFVRPLQAFCSHATIDR